MILHGVQIVQHCRLAADKSKSDLPGQNLHCMRCMHRVFCRLGRMHMGMSNSRRSCGLAATCVQPSTLVVVSVKTTAPDVSASLWTRLGQ